MFSCMSSRRLVVFSGLVTLGVVLSAILLGYFQMKTVREKYDSTLNASETARRARMLFIDTLNVVVMQRAFLLTGSSIIEVAYRDALPSISRGFTALFSPDLDVSNLTSSILLPISPATPTGALARLTQMLDKEVETRKRCGPSCSLQELDVNPSLGNSQSDEIRTALNRVIDLQDDEVANAKRVTENAVRNMTLSTFIAIGFIACSMIIGICLSSNWEARKEQRINAELAKLLTQAQAATNTKTLFLSNMSHELRTPMHGIITMCNELTSTVITAEQADILRTVKVSADAMMRLVDRILLFCKLDSGSFAVDLDNFDLSGFLSEIENTYDERSRAQNIAFRTFVDEEVPRYVYSDRKILSQIVTNLLDNALKFTRSGYVHLYVSTADGSDLQAVLSNNAPNDVGTESLTTKFPERNVRQEKFACNIVRSVTTSINNQQHEFNVISRKLSSSKSSTTSCGQFKATKKISSNDLQVQLGPTTSIHCVVFKVVDTGIGIDGPNHDTVFTPFSQVDMSSTRVHGGAGLGLAISKQLANLLGGDIVLTSTLQHGSKLTLVVPIPPLRKLELSRTDASLEHNSMSSDKSARMQGTNMNEPGTHTAVNKLRTYTDTSPSSTVLVIHDEVLSRPDNDGQVRWPEQSDAKLLPSGAACHITAEANPHGLPRNLSHQAIKTFSTLPIHVTSPLSPRAASRSHLSPSLSASFPIISVGVVPPAEDKAFETVSSTSAVCASDPLPSQLQENSISDISSKNTGLLSKHSCTASSKDNHNSRGRFKFRVLLAEDNLINQKVMLRLLDRCNCDVVVANNGIEAVTAYKNCQLPNNFDVILMDIHMPLLDGIEATKQIRHVESSYFSGQRISNKHRIYIMAVTASVFEHDRKACIEAGMDDVLTKPVDIGVLKSKLNSLPLRSRGQCD